MAAKKKAVVKAKAPNKSVGSTKQSASTKKRTKAAAAEKKSPKKPPAKKLPAKKPPVKKGPTKKAAANNAPANNAPVKKTASKAPKKPAPKAPKKAQSKKAPAKELDALRVSALFSVPAERLYDAWLDAAEHAAFTGGGATSSPDVGGRHSAWDGYIEGTNLELLRPSKIVQSWRTTEFPDDADESRLEILLVPEGDGTRLVLHHTAIPKGQGAQYEAGWEEHYFVPMKKYFGD